MSNIDQIIHVHRDNVAKLFSDVAAQSLAANTKEKESEALGLIVNAVANTAADIATIAVCLRSIAVSLEKLSEKVPVDT